MSAAVGLLDPRARALPDGFECSPLGLVVPTRPRPRYDRPVAIDLFCGAGGMGLGFHQAGWHVAAASDFEPVAAATYMVNLARPGVRIHGLNDDSLDDLEKHLIGEPTDSLTGLSVAGSGWISSQPPEHRGCEHFFLGDIKRLTGAMVLDALGMQPGEVGCVTGGPPCQGFSQAGRQNVMDERNSLVFEFARLIVEIAPQTFVMENVPAILQMVTPEGIPVVDAFCLAVSESGYGTYDALRRAMTSTQGARAGTRQTSTQEGSARSKRNARAKAKASDTPSLFDGVA